jgi:hypothetical protein
MQSNMVQETSTFNRWLEAVGKAARGAGLAETFDVVAWCAQEEFGARLRFVSVLGRRRSYLAGHRSQAPCGEPLAQVALGRHVEMIVESWGTLSDCMRGGLIAFLRNEVIAMEQQP